MSILNANQLQLAVGIAGLLAVGGLALWLVFRKRPTPEELERARRLFLVQSGRLVDGMLFDIAEVTAEDGRTLTMLLFNYRIAGVIYDCSQDVTDLKSVVDPAQVRAGFPCTVRYQPGNPQNSIVVAEDWTGLRGNLPALPAFEDPEPVDTSHLKTNNG
jgi:hypothetical protein